MTDESGGFSSGRGLGGKHKLKKRKIFPLILLAFCLFSAPAYAGPGATEEENAAIEADRARLTDNVLEFGEVGARVENYNATLVNLNATLKNSYLNYEAAEALGNDARDLKDDDMDEETRLLYEEYRDMAQEARKAAMKLHDKELPSSAKRIIRQTTNTLQKTVENLIITYHTTAANAPMLRLLSIPAIMGSCMVNDITMGTIIRISPEVRTECDVPSYAALMASALPTLLRAAR